MRNIILTLLSISLLIGSEIRTTITGSTSGGSGSTRVIYTTGISGINCNGSLGANTGTDDKSKIQAVLDTASSTNPLKLVLDCVSLIDTTTSGLVIKSYTTISGLGWNTGFSWKGSANANQQVLLTNANPIGTGTPTDQYITLENFAINGNGTVGHGGSGTYPLVTNSNGLFLSCTRFTGVNTLTIQNIKTIQAPSYGIHAGNVTNFIISRIRAEHDTARVGTDGVHINGPASNFHISDISGATGDDLVALNADDGHMVGSTGNIGCFGDNASASTIKYGPITNGIVEGIYPEASWSAFRLLSAISNIDAVTIRHIKGTAFHRAAYIDNDPGELAAVGGGNFGNIVVEGMDIVPSAIPDAGSIILAATFKSVHLGLVSTNHTVAKPFITTDSTTNIGQLIVDIGNSSNTSGLPNPIISIASGSIKHVTLKGHYDSGSGIIQSTNPIISVSGGSIDTVSFDGIYADRIDTILDISGGSVDTVSLGSGRHLRANGNYTVNVGTGVTVASKVQAGFASFSPAGGAGTITNSYNGIFSDSVPDPGTSSILSGLTAFWHLTEASGASRSDSSGNSHTMANNGTVGQASASPQSGNIAVLDGTVTNFLSSSGSSFTISGSTGFTFSMWVRMKNLTDNHIFFAKAGPDGSHHEMALYYNPANGFFALHVNGVNVNFSSTTPVADTWYLVTGGWTPTGGGKPFISVNAATNELGSTVSVLSDTGNPLWIGKVSTVSCHSDVGHAGWWSRVLNSTEVGTLYNAGAFFDPI